MSYNDRDRYWSTGAGVAIKVRGMTESHLRNALHWCRRNDKPQYIVASLDGAVLGDLVEPMKVWPTKDGLFMDDWVEIFDRELRHRGKCG